MAGSSAMWPLITGMKMLHTKIIKIRVIQGSSSYM